MNRRTALQVVAGWFACLTGELHAQAPKPPAPNSSGSIDLFVAPHPLTYSMNLDDVSVDRFLFTRGAERVEITAKELFDALKGSK